MRYEMTVGGDVEFLSDSLDEIRNRAVSRADGLCRRSGGHETVIVHDKQLNKRMGMACAGVVSKWYPQG